MKIAIFENERSEVDGIFRYLNTKSYFDGKLQVEYFPSSQDFADLKNLGQWDLVFVDIDLSANSELDGYGLISQIYEVLPSPPVIAIITGHAFAQEKLPAGGGKLRIFNKPLLVDDINEFIKKNEQEMH